MMIRKVQHAPDQTGPAPSLQTAFDFVMSDKPLQLEASLEKQVSFTTGSNQPLQCEECG